MKKEGRKRPLTDRFFLPPQVVPGVPRTVLSGGSQVLIENYGGLKTYTRRCIEVKTRDGLLRVTGDDLELAAMTKTDIVIRGFVISVELC